ncbi:DinB family protein [Niallia taxi]|uniref:DinB family protein n=1 Tax=Niallia taxi TaxID=2499688 RepID=A0A3S2TW99_9BACI|nr:DinB family protein [Niallia taxi]RVT60747.1 DinB family protein [Niallia taxi]
MEKVINGINHWIQALPKEFTTMSVTEISNRSAPNKWSKKEILGHLCDSAINNLGRFLQVQYEEQPYVIQPYNQVQCVILQNYQERPLQDIVTLFQALNNQIVHVLQNIPSEKLSYICDIGNNEEKTLEWLIQDYLEHMEHHIYNQILVK